MATTNPSPSPPPPPSTKKRPAAPKGPPWSEAETAHLIRAYQEKWYSLKRGLLRSHQWDAVALSVAALCGLDRPSKSGVQCRHKMEKLRKRYRDELQRPLPSRWHFFPLMDQLERGPLPISSLKPPPSPPSSSSEEVVVSGAGRRVRCRRDRGDEPDPAEAETEPEADGVDWREEAAATELAEVMMRFEEGFLRIEKRRMEIMREFERDLMELEARRAEMAFESRRCLVDVVHRVFRSGRGKLKRPPPPPPPPHFHHHHQQQN